LSARPFAALRGAVDQAWGKKPAAVVQWCV
jgi:hypothetical protein